MKKYINKGFSLAELGIAMVILLIVATISTISYFAIIDNAKEVKVVEEARTIRLSLARQGIDIRDYSTPVVYEDLEPKVQEVLNYHLENGTNLIGTVFQNKAILRDGEYVIGELRVKSSEIDSTTAFISEFFNISKVNAEEKIVKELKIRKLDNNEMNKLFNEEFKGDWYIVDSLEEVISEPKYLIKDGVNIKVYKETGEVVLNDISPIMTSETNSDGVTVTSDSNYSKDFGWKVFDENNVSRPQWYTSYNRPAGGHWLKIDMVSERKINAVDLRAFRASNDPPTFTIKNWELYGSNDDENYEIITTGTQEANALAQSYIFDNENFYRYFRFNFLDTHTSKYYEVNGVFDLKLYEYDKEMDWFVVGTEEATEDMFEQYGMADLSVIDEEAKQKLDSGEAVLLCSETAICPNLSEINKY